MHQLRRSINDQLICGPAERLLGRPSCHDDSTLSDQLFLNLNHSLLTTLINIRPPNVTNKRIRVNQTPVKHQFVTRYQLMSFQ